MHFRMDTGEPPGFASTAPRDAPPVVAGPQNPFAQTEPHRPAYLSQQEFRVDLRNWRGTLLDTKAKPDTYLAWHSRALDTLCGNRADVRHFLLWAERQSTAIDWAAEQHGARAASLAEDVTNVSLVLYAATKSLLADSLLDMARACGDGRGLELWRRLAAQWRGNAPQILAAKARRYATPQRCASVAALWEQLPAWEQLGSDLDMGGWYI